MYLSRRRRRCHQWGCQQEEEDRGVPETALNSKGHQHGGLRGLFGDTLPHILPCPGTWDTPNRSHWEDDHGLCEPRWKPMAGPGGSSWQRPALASPPPGLLAQGWEDDDFRSTSCLVYPPPTVHSGARQSLMRALWRSSSNTCGASSRETTWAKPGRPDVISRGLHPTSRHKSMAAAVQLLPSPSPQELQYHYHGRKMKIS